MDRSNAARIDLCRIYAARFGLRVEGSFSMGRARPWLRRAHCVRAAVERVARRILSLSLEHLLSSPAGCLYQGEARDDAGIAAPQVMQSNAPLSCMRTARIKPNVRA